MEHSELPLATLLLNVTGSFLLGLMAGLSEPRSVGGTGGPAVVVRLV